MNIPKGKGPFPLILLNHGYYNPSTFQSGDGTRSMAEILANKGYLSNNTFDNYFDYETRNAVMLFQQNNYLSTDGVVGRNTRNYLY
jgi:peptidoglycan hydrolase-like protein with peptidoglycan-binding domain